MTIDSHRPTSNSRLFCALRFVVALCAVGTGVTFAARPGGRAMITFQNVFKSGHPEFVEIKISDDGSGTYDIRQLDQIANPQAFQVSPPLAKVIFALAAKLDDFHDVDLNAGAANANLSHKTFSYEGGGRSYEVTFTSTHDKSATELLVIFSSLARQEGDLAALVRALRYEPLGVNDALLQIQNDCHLFLEPRQLLPTLDRVAADDQIINIARRRASALAVRIRLGQ
jgi:hypothetical protein